MFSRKKAEPAKPKRRNHNLAQFGLTEIDDDFDPSAGFGDDGTDSDLEAELNAIAGGGKPKPKAKPKPTLMPDADLDKMIADSLRDVGSDEDDDNVEDDPDLLGELHDIAGPLDGDEPPAEESAEGKPDESPTEMFLPTTTVDTVGVIRTRIEMYTQAVANAKAGGEAAKARRFERGLKTLNDLLRQASSGKAINVDDIPPEVSVKPKAAPAEDTPAAAAATPEESPSEPAPKVPSRAAPPPPPRPVEEPAEAAAAPPSEKESLVQRLRTLQGDYKAAALQSKRSGDLEMAKQFIKVVKQFDLVVKMVEEGQEVDLSDMPPPPEQFKAFLEQMQAQGAEAPEPVAPPPPAEEPKPVTPPQPAEMSTPSSMLEALQQRLDKYKSVEEAAKAEGNSSKARRFGRIVKQYEDAVKAYKAGRPVPYDELPVPPGFGPLPGEAAAAAAAPKPSVPSTPAETNTATPTSPTTPSDAPTVPKRTPPKPDDLTTRISGNHQKNNLAEQQMKILLDRQKEFKLAAIEAKKAGELDQAREYLKIFKGFDALLNAASSGLPVDLNTLPLPPSQRENLEASFAIVTTDECDPDEDISDIGVRIEEQLAKQLMMCKNTRDHHKAMGDVAGMNRFENLALTVQKDLDLVRYSKRKNFPLPKFHYEKRSFNIVHCNTDLTDNELEIVVVRGLNFNVANPKEVDTYVKIEFPLLNDETFSTKTSLVKDTNNPDYNQRFKVEIQRGNRQFQRIFKRHGVKFEVYSRGGFLRSDNLIGTVTAKLQPLETKCDIHDTFDLMEGRKTVRGKLEIQLRVRNPILTKQVEHINEKWLVLDG